MPNQIRISSVGQKIFWRSFWWLLLLACLIFFAQSLVILQRVNTAKLQQVQSMIAVLEPSLARAAWQINPNAMKIIVRSMVSLEGVTVASFVDDNMAVEAVSAEQGTTPAEELWKQCETMFERDLTGTGTDGAVLPNGLLKLCFVRSDVFSEIAATLPQQGLIILLIVALAALVPAMIAKWNVLDPIQRLTSDLREGANLPLRDPARIGTQDHDEIDLLYRELNERTAAIRYERDVSTQTFENLLDGIAITDGNFNISRMNPAFRRLLGKDVREAQDVREALPSGTVSAFGQYDEVELADGKILAIGLHHLPPDVTADRLMVVLRDITDLRTMERKSLQDQKLVALGTFSSGVAHDFNNLLAVIMGAAELLENVRGDDPRRRDLLNEIVAATQSGKRLTGQLLTFARKRELAKEHIDPNEFIPNTLAMARRIIGSLYNIELSGRSELALYSDKAMLETALLNLIQNAGDAMPAGGRIGVEISDQVTPNGLQLAIAVHNDGPPIPKEILQRMTEPFFTTKGASGGTGLGLSMVLGFCEQQGGTLEATSTGSSGTTVRILLPAIPQAEVVDASKTLSPARKDDSARRVLFVEDDEKVRKIGELMIRSFGHELWSFGSLDALKDFARQHGVMEWDVVLCDFALAGHTGIQVLNWLRSQCVHAPVYIISGHLSSETVELISRTDAKGTLAKPLRRADLAQVLGSAV